MFFIANENTPSRGYFVAERRESNSVRGVVRAFRSVFELEPIANEDLLAEEADDQACNHVVVDIIVETADCTMKKQIAPLYFHGSTPGKITPGEVAGLVGLVDNVLEMRVAIATVLHVQCVKPFAQHRSHLANGIGDVHVAIRSPATDEPDVRYRVIPVVVVWNSKHEVQGLGHGKAETVDLADVPGCTEYVYGCPKVL